MADTHEQVKEFKELFDSLDSDGGGHIDVDELAGSNKVQSRSAG
jgi:Ca2+-binding EF-hand superfamily protein